MGGAKTGGSMPLPRICGFNEGFFFGHKFAPEDEHKMSSMLGSQRFQKGNRAARCYANLVVLFRLLLFHGPLMNDARFWGWIATDWGIVDGNRALVGEVANFYSDARYAELVGHNGEKRLSLLVRLVDEWLLIRPRPEVFFSETVDDAKIHATRSAWLNIRDHHVDMLMDAKLPGCLAGVELPTKIVTSLWETDPEVAALLKEVKTKRKSKSFGNKFKPTSSASTQPPPTGSEVVRKRTMSLSEGEIDEGEPAPEVNDSVFDERSFTPHMENDGHGLTLRPDRPRKRHRFAWGSQASEIYLAESADTFDLLDFTAAARRAPLRSYEKAQQPMSPKPSPACEPAEQPLPTSAPSSVQATLSPWAGGSRMAATTPREKLSAQLRVVAGQTKRRQEELHVRVELETTGCVPFPSDANGSDRPALEVGGGLGASEREMYESRLHDLEQRVEALERALQRESSWARAMSQFLYDANGKSVRSLKDVFFAIDTLQKTSLTLLEKSQETDK